MAIDPTAPASLSEQHDCLRKVRLTEAGAERSINLWAKRGKTMRAYKCPWCHGYHLTSRPRPVVD